MNFNKEIMKTQKFRVYEGKDNNMIMIEKYKIRYAYISTSKYKN